MVIQYSPDEYEGVGMVSLLGGFNEIGPTDPKPTGT
jgi:hypothetical protein